jgi:hypothetical protein
LLLAGDGYALATATGTSIGLGALATGRQASSVALTAIAINFNQTLDVETFHTSQVTFDLKSALFNLFTEAADFVFSQVVNPAIFRNAYSLRHLAGSRVTDAVDVSKRDVCSLAFRQIYTGDAGHLSSRIKSLQYRGLTLALLVLWVFANDGHSAFTADDLAFVTDFFDRSSNFHESLALVLSK